MTKEERNSWIQFKYEQAAALYIEGTQMSDLIGIFNLAEEGLQKYLKRQGIVKKKREIAFAAAEEMIINEYYEGKTSTEISFHLNINNMTVERFLRKNNLSVTKRQLGGKTFSTYKEVLCYRKELHKKVIRLHKEGRVVNEIALLCELPLFHVKHILTLCKNNGSLR